KSKPDRRKRRAKKSAKATGVGAFSRKARATGRQSGTRAVVLIGFMGAGKSSVGRALGEQLGWAFEDLDERIERRERRKVAEIFRDSGESGFRRAEHAALRELVKGLNAGAEKIVALGGGAFVQKENARLVGAGGFPTVFLDASVEELWRRCRQQVEEQGMERPLLGSLARFQDLYEARRPHYLKASLRQETGGKTIEEIAAELVQALGLDRSRGRRGEKQ
ncbi:MAG: shikimate kinase, partial [Candidatus Sulfotelmatobacter sp.]